MSTQLVTVHRERLVDLLDLTDRALEWLSRENSNDPLVSALHGANAEIKAELLVPVG